jgi:3'(2'), 5'-bisphosphate nucleotidase
MHIDEIRAVLQLLVAAGDEILRIYSSDDIGEEAKADLSPVTKADKASSRLINDGLKRIFSGIPVVDEENPMPPYEDRQNWEKFFVLDPLDGTREFIKRNGEFCINLALIVNNLPEEGWIYHPVSGKGWYCRKGEGVKVFNDSFNLEPAPYKSTPEEQTRIVTSRSFFNSREVNLIEKARLKFNASLDYLGASLKHIALSEGEADLYIKASYSAEWDTAPGQLILEESGGAVLRFSDFCPLDYNKPDPGNPDFIMIGRKLNNSRIISLLKEIISEELISDQE